MASVVHATEASEPSSWQINSDAFAPPPTRRLVRGWDRAPVPAHAPRLHGQKVWKKVGLRATNGEDGKGEEAQEELQKEGAGARKKSRMMGTREDIGNAIWVDAVPDTYAHSLQITDDIKFQAEHQSTPEISTTTSLRFTANTSQSRDESTPLSLHHEILTSTYQLIPRKRTNTNHVITPRKPLRQTTLNQQAQPVFATAANGEQAKAAAPKVAKPRKSLRKSISAKMSEGAAERRSSRAHQARTTLNVEPCSDAENVAPVVEQLEPAIVAEKKTRRISRRRSTVAARRSVVIVELKAENYNKGEQIIGEDENEGTEISHPTPLQYSISVEGVKSTSSDGPPKTATEAVHDTSIATDPVLETSVSNEVEIPGGEDTADSTSISESRGVNLAQESLGLSTEANDVEDRTHSLSTQKGPVEPAAKILSPDTAMLGKVDAGLELQDVAPAVQAPAAQLQNVSDAELDAVTTEAAASGGDPAPEVLAVVSPVEAECSSSVEAESEVSQPEIDAPLDVPAEPEAPQEAQDIEARQGLDSTIDSAAVAEATTANVPVLNYDHDDTDMLRNFLTRVKANKAAKNPPKRKRSLPHSPLRIPLGDMDNNLSPSPQRLTGETDLTEPSPSKRRKAKNSPLSQVEDNAEPPPSCRRSNRTRLPVKEPPGAPSFIPVRRFGQDADNATVTLTLKRNEDKELAALTRVNTRKNKGNSLTTAEVLAKKSEEKEDPAMRQRLLKEVFEEKAERGRQVDKDRKGREKKNVKWAEELAQFQTLPGTVIGTAVGRGKGKGKGTGKAGGDSDEKEAEQEKEKAALVAVEEKKQQQGAVRVGVRSKAALGMVLNGTPAPKRKMRGKA